MQNYKYVRLKRYRSTVIKGGGYAKAYPPLCYGL